MTEALPWLSQLREMVQRQQGDDDPTEQLSLSVADVLATVPDYEICEAYHLTSDAGEPVSDVLAAECERRNLDF